MTFISPISNAASRRDRGNEAQGAVLEDGEYLTFNILLRDALSIASPLMFDAAERQSLEESLKVEIQSAAELSGQKPSEWMASNTGPRLEKLIAGVVRTFVAGVSGDALASRLSLDASTANANALRAVTGRAPVPGGDRIREIHADAARSAAERRSANDAAVAAAIEKYAPKPRLTVDSAKAQQAAAVRDLVRDGQHGTQAGPAAIVRNPTAVAASGAAIRDAARAVRYL